MGRTGWRGELLPGQPVALRMPLGAGALVGAACRALGALEGHPPSWGPCSPYSRGEVPSLGARDWQAPPPPDAGKASTQPSCCCPP